MAIASAVGDLLELRVYCTLGDQTSINVLHYTVTAITGDGDLAGAVGPWDLAIAAKYKDCMSSSATYRGISLQRLLPVPSVAVISNANAGPGVNAVDALPKQSCGLIRKQTEFSGRKEHGRVYIPFPAEDTNSLGGFPSAGYVTILNALAAQLMDDGPYVTLTHGVTVYPVLFSPTDGGIRPIMTMTGQPYWATQRRRGDYGRPNASPV